MPMPHADMKRLIQRRLRGTDGSERLRIARECMSMLPGYKQGPYADLRKWLAREMETTQKRREVRHAEDMFIARDGDARVVLLGPPNAGKSSLLKSLSGSSVQVGDYAFTTLRPIAATAVINDARIQLVEIPGLIEGAQENRGGGRLYLGAAQDADGYLLVMPLEMAASPEAAAPALRGTTSRQPVMPTGFDQMLAEVESIICDRPVAVAATKADLPGAEMALAAASVRLAGLTIVAVSTTTGQGLGELANVLWEMTGLMRVYSKQEDLRPSNNGGKLQDRQHSTGDTITGAPTRRPFIIPRGSTVLELASHIHKELSEELDKAAVWGPSAKFPGQVVGKAHVLHDEDTVRLFKRRGKAGRSGPAG